MTPASDSLLALTITMTRIRCLLMVLKVEPFMPWSNEGSRIDTAGYKISHLAHFQRPCARPERRRRARRLPGRVSPRARRECPGRRAGDSHWRVSRQASTPRIRPRGRSRLRTGSRTGERPVAAFISTTSSASTFAISPSRLVRWGGRLVSGGRTISSLVTQSCRHRAAPRSSSGRLLRGRGRGHRRASGAAWPTVGFGDRADGVQLHDRAVGHVGARARGVRDPTWERPHRKASTCEFRVDHVMASAALPFFFPRSKSTARGTATAASG